MVRYSRHVSRYRDLHARAAAYRQAPVSSRSEDTGQKTWPPFHVRAALPFAVEYGLFILVNNIDVLIAYVVLDNYALGVYAASTALPKALVTATYPVSQVMLPVMSAFGRDRRARHIALLKALFVCALFGAAGAIGLSVGSGLACNDTYGFRFCSPRVLTMLALSSIALGVTRVLVVAGLALGNQRHFVIPLLMLITFAFATIIWGRMPESNRPELRRLCPRRRAASKRGAIIAPFLGVAWAVLRSGRIAGIDRAYRSISIEILSRAAYNHRLTLS
jgi:Polysaccharide biosynthesis protein